MYSSGWQGGVSLSYNIDNLYKNQRERVKLGELQKNQANDAILTLVQQNLDMTVNAAYTKYQEAIQQTAILNDAKV